MIESFPVEVIDAAILRARPGDLVIVRCFGPIRDEQAEKIRGLLERLLPEGVSVIVVENGVSFEVRDG